MITTIEIEDHTTAMFAQMLAQESGCGLDVGEYFQDRMYTAMREHPATRECADPRCGSLVDPILSIQEKKHVPNPHYRAEITAVPATQCPECGGPVITVAEAQVLDKARATAETMKVDSMYDHDYTKMSPEELDRRGKKIRAALLLGIDGFNKATREIEAAQGAAVEMASPDESAVVPPHEKLDVSESNMAKLVSAIRFAVSAGRAKAPAR